MALGALSMSISKLQEKKYPIETETDGAKIPDTCDKRIEKAEEHYVFALRLYSRAIQKTKETMFAKPPGLRNALLVSLLIVGFETYHGDHQSAARQVRVIVKLLKGHSSSATPPLAEILEKDIIRAVNRLGIRK